MQNKGVITEGQLDVITAWQKGIKIVTSSFGAHCSENHFIILNRYTDNMIVMYDNDEAGKKGNDMALKIAKNHNFKIKIKCPLNQGIDLDTWLKCHTKEDFQNIINYDAMAYLKNRLNKMGQYI